MKLSSLLIACFLAFSANAAIVADGNTTIDESTGLRWLDPILTRGYNLNGTVSPLCGNNPCLSLSDAFGQGGAFAGYRIATSDEVLTLMTNAGITDFGSPRYGPLTANGAAIISLGQKLGPAWMSSGGQYVIGYATSTHWTGRPASDVVAPVMGFEDSVFGEDPISTAESVFVNFASIGSLEAPLGFWLVTSVPLPLTAVLFGSGIISLTVFQRRRQPDNRKYESESI